MKNFIQALKELQEEKPGLWANIRAKRARGEKPAHKNSNAHKDAVKAGKKIKKEGEGNEREIKGQELVDYIMGHWGWSEDKTLNWLANNFGKNKQDDGPKEEDQNYIDYLRRSGRDKEADKLVALNPDKIKETANTQDGKAAPYGSGYKKVTKEDIRSFVISTLAEMQNNTKKPATYAGRPVIVHMNGPETEWKVEILGNGKIVDYIDMMANLKFDDGTTYMDYLKEDPIQEEEVKSGKKK